MAYPLSFLWAVDDNFENLGKMTFQREKGFRKPSAVGQISTTLKSENGFELTSYRVIRSGQGIGTFAKKPGPSQPTHTPSNHQLDSRIN